MTSKRYLSYVSCYYSGFPSPDLKALAGSLSIFLIADILHNLSVSGTVILIKYALHVPWPHKVRWTIWIVLANEVILVSAELRRQKKPWTILQCFSPVLENNNDAAGGASVSLGSGVTV